MARTTPINSGYTIVSGTGTGTYGSRIDVWVEYKVISQSVETNTSNIRAYFYAALKSGQSASTENDEGLASSFAVNDVEGAGWESIGYSFTKQGVPCVTSSDVDNEGVKENYLARFVGSIVHGADGTKSVTIKGSFTTLSTYISGGNINIRVTLPTIPKASNIDNVWDVTLGNSCFLKFTPKAASMRFKLDFSCGNWSETSGLFHPNTTNQYTYNRTQLPLDVAWQFDGSSATMQVILYTYSDAAGENQIGMDTKTFTVVVPDNAYTKPTVTMNLSPGTTPISGLYIQGLSTVKASISATDPYGATIKSYSVKVGGTSYVAPYTSGYLNTTGTVKVTGYATSSRDFVGSKESSIQVIPYSRPQIQNVSVVRCTQDGTQNEDGTYLKISATRDYSKVISGGTQHNYCQIRFRYKAETDSAWSAWTTILANDVSADTVTTNAMIGNLSAEKVYNVEVGVLDTLGYHAVVSIAIATKSVYMHRRAGGKALGLGKYVEEDDLLDVAWNTILRGNVSGRVLGMGALPSIPEGADANDYKDYGAWGVYTSATAGTIANLPTNKAGTFRVWSANGGGAEHTDDYIYIMQEYITFDNSGTYRRSIQLEAWDKVWKYNPWKSCKWEEI